MIVRADLVGNVLRVERAAGDHVEAGEVLLVVESMKMENPVVAPVTGTVTALRVEVGDVVHLGDVLVELEPRA